jgi:hypothetical protein
MYNNNTGKLGKYGHLKELSSLYKKLQCFGAYKNYLFALTITVVIHMRYNLTLIVNKVQYSFEQNLPMPIFAKLLRLYGHHYL